MSLKIDHMCLVVANLYEGAQRLRDETGFAAYDGGWFSQWGGAQKTVPLGRDNYLEIESIIDPQRAAENHFGRYMQKVASRGDHLVGATLCAETHEEIMAFAKRNGMTAKRDWGRIRPDGTRNRLIAISGVDHAWPRGLPSVSFFPDMNDHPSRAYKADHLVQPDGVAWLEWGDEDAVRSWLGDEADNLPFKYVDRPAGLYAIAVRTVGGPEVVIRRTAATWVNYERPPADKAGDSRQGWIPGFGSVTPEGTD